MIEKLTEIFAGYWKALMDAAPDILAAVLILLFFFALGQIFYRIISKRFASYWDETIVTAFIARVIKWIFYLIGTITAMDILGFGGLVSSLVAGAGVSAIIIGIAFKDIGENFLAGILLAINRPFKIGDIIEVEGQKGTVKELNIRTTHVRNVEGKDIYIPNSIIVKNVFINYTKDGLLRQSFVIGLDVPTDISKAKILILDYIEKQPDILKKPKPDVFTTNLGEFTVDVKVLFWVDLLKNKTDSPSLLGESIRSRIMSEVKDLLLENNYNLPSQVIEHKNYNESISLKIKNEG